MEWSELEWSKSNQKYFDLWCEHDLCLALIEYRRNENRIYAEALDEINREIDACYDLDDYFWISELEKEAKQTREKFRESAKAYIEVKNKQVELEEEIDALGKELKKYR